MATGIEREPETVRPYFLWWTDLTEADFAHRLRDSDPAVRAYWLGALLREAHTSDVWRFTTPATVRAEWPQVVRHLGRTRAMWAWLLRIDPGDEMWPPRPPHSPAVDAALPAGVSGSDAISSG